MKKRITLLLIFAFVLSISLMGCGGQQEEPQQSGESTPEEPAKVEQTQITLITGSTGGTYYALGGAMANTFTKYLDNIQVTSQPSGASVENINRLNAGEVELGIAMNNIADDAWNGQNSYSEPVQNFRAIGVVYPEVFQGVALKETGIKTIEDLKGKRVAVGPVGSGTLILTQLVLEEAGLTFNDITANYDGFGDASGKMKDGHLDAAFNVLSVPAAAIQDIQTVRDIEIIEIKDDLYEAIHAKYPFFSQYIIPAGTYGNEEDKYTVNCQAALYVATDLPEDLVYDITKIWYENTAEVAQAHAAAQWLADEMAAGNLETALMGITTPLHPGAYKYFVEKGIEVPDEIKPID